MNGQNKNQMNPKDTRNLFIFFAFSLVLYLGYEHFILGPQREALARVKEYQQTHAQTGTLAANPEQVQEKTRAEALSASPRIKIENPEIHGSISLRGGRIDDVALRGYYVALDHKDNVNILSPKDSPHPRYIEHGWVSDDKAVKLPTSDTLWQANDAMPLKPGQPVTLSWNNGEGLTFTKEFALDEHNLITVRQSVINSGAQNVTLFPYGLVAQRGLPEVLQTTWILHEGPIAYVTDALWEISYKSLRETPRQEYSGAAGWTGITDKYWLTTLVPPQGQQSKYSFSYAGTPPANKKDKDTGLYQADYTGAAIVVAPGQTQVTETHVFAGPKRVHELERYEQELNIPRFDLAVNFGWFWFMSKPFFLALHFLGEITGNFGIAIILLTIVIRSSVFPLTNASFKSFAKMKKVTPQVAKLRRDYSNDKTKLQQELMQLYQREGVNPMAGCIPMLIQIPIFFALYKVLYITIEMRHAPFFGWIKDLSAPDPTSIFNLFGLIPWEPPTFLHIGVWPCLMLLAMVIQRKLNPPPQDPIQRDMALYFPFLMAFMMSRFAAGLVIYWTFSATISILQQMLIMHRMGVPIYILGQSPEEKELEAQIEKGPAVHPLTEMAEEEIEGAMFDDGPTKPVTPPKRKKKKKK